MTKTGSVDGGYIVYSLSIDGEYTTTIPVATEAGNYRVYWTIECVENHYVDGTPGSSRVTIAAKDASNATVTLDDTSVQFDGTAKTPGVTSVVVDGKTLNAETDYEVSYRDNTYVGTATVTITFKGNYTGTATVTFEINKDPKTGEFDGEWVQMKKTMSRQDILSCLDLSQIGINQGLCLFVRAISTKTGGTQRTLCS